MTDGARRLDARVAVTARSRHDLEATAAGLRHEPVVLVPGMRGRDREHLVGLRNGRHPPAARLRATKGALGAATRSLAVELGSTGIRVNSVAHGVLDTTRWSDVDVLVAASSRPRIAWDRIRRIVVPTNGSSQALAGVEVAGRLAESCGAEVVLLAVVDPAVASVVERRGSGTSRGIPGTAHLDDARWRCAPWTCRCAIACVTASRRRRSPARCSATTTIWW